MVLITPRPWVHYMHGPFTQELDSMILVDQLRIFWDSVAGDREEKKRSKKKAQRWAICVRILYILRGHCVCFNTSYFRTKGTKRMRN